MSSCMYHSTLGKPGGVFTKNINDNKIGRIIRLAQWPQLFIHRSASFFKTIEPTGTYC